MLLAIIQTDAVTAKLKFPPIFAAIETLRPAKRVVFAGLDEGAVVPPDYVERLRALNVPYFPSAERAVRALARLARWNGAASAAPPTPRPAGTAAFAALRAWSRNGAPRPPSTSIGIPFRQAALATTPGGGRRDRGEDRLSGRHQGAVRRACAQERRRRRDRRPSRRGRPRAGMGGARRHIKRSRPGLALDGVLIEAMGAPGVELIVGGRNDPDWGPVVVVGFGGVQAEILKDSRLLTPTWSNFRNCGRAQKLKGAALLEGFRGSPTLDVDAAVRIVRAVGRLLLDEPSIREIDLNPVVIYPRGEGALALDALIVASS